MMSLALAMQAIAAFNLVCSGTLRSGPIGVALPEEGGEPFAITYRIDLSSRLWCSDPCNATEPVAEIVDGAILLRDQHRPSGSHVIVFTPRTGRFADTLNEDDFAVLRSGRCEPAPFEGFPLSVA
jgi:hypothetical protein